MENWNEEHFIGEVVMFAGSYEPHGWMVCDGRRLMKDDNVALYSVLGNTYGGTEDDDFYYLPSLQSETKGVKYIICAKGIYPSRS